MGSNMKKVLIILFILSILTISACTPKDTGQTTTTQGGTKIVSMVIGHTFYQPPDTITVNKGDKVRIEATAAQGTGSHKHGIAIDEYGINKAVTTEDKNNPTIIEFTADKQGTFKIYCKSCLEGPYGENHPKIEAKLVVQ